MLNGGSKTTYYLTALIVRDGFVRTQVQLIESFQGNYIVQKKDIGKSYKCYCIYIDNL